MGKKHDLKQMAKRNIKILSSDKIKLKKGQKISIKPYVKESVDGSIVSRFEGIIDQNTEKFTASHEVKVGETLLGQIKTADIMTHAVDSSDNITPTIVKFVTKKNALNFDFAGDDVIGDLLRTSTLGPVYEKIKSDWKKINTNDKSSFTNVLFIPKLFVFNNGIEAIMSPYRVNFLLISVPNVKTFKEELTDEELEKVSYNYIARVLGDVFEAATRIKGCDNLIIDPFDLKFMNDYVDETVSICNYITSTPKVRKTINSVFYSIENEYYYVKFTLGIGSATATAKFIDEAWKNFADKIFTPNKKDDMKEDKKVDTDMEEIKEEILNDIKENTKKKKEMIKKKLDKKDE